MVALFPGSFDPFTIGHADIVRRALPLFDKVIIAVGINGEKTPCFPLEQRLQAIRNTFSNEPRVEVRSYSGLTIDLAREVCADVLLRGVRSTIDFEYERAMADANRELLPGLETILLYTSPQFAHISSSLVRDLYRHNHDIASYLPEGGQLKGI